MRLLFKIVYRVQRWFFGVRQWAGRRFTPVGLTVLIGLILAGLFGPDTDNNVAYQAFTVLFALLLLAVCFSGFFRARFAVRRVLPQFGTAGAPFSYTVRVQSLGARPQRDLTLLENLDEPRPKFDDWLAHRLAAERQVRSFRFSTPRLPDPFRATPSKPSTLDAVSAGEEREVTMELTPLRRGVLRFKSLVVARSDPLGLFRGFQRVPLAQSVLILPRRYPLPPIALPGTVKYQEGGVALAANIGQSEEFVSLRDYRRGDPLRHIHWRSWAKAGKPVVREFEDEFFVRHALILDTFTELPRSEVFEEAVSVAASFACAVQTQESLLDLLFVGPHSYCFTAGRGLAQVDQLLEVLASVQPCRDQTFRSLECLVLQHVEVVSGCICVLLAWDRERQDLVRKLKALGVPVLVLVVTEPGRGDELDPGPMQDDPSRFRALEVGKVEPGLAVLQ